MKPLKHAHILDIDQRFAVLAPEQYVYYDLDEPEVFPESLKGTVDLAIIDPPFLNEESYCFTMNLLSQVLTFWQTTNQKLVQTLRQILKPTDGKLLLLTSLSVEPVLKKLYNNAPVGPLYMTALNVDNGQLANDFACWGNWPGAEQLGQTTS
jgi:EEF1A lysine methyltransferase 1